LLSVGEAVEAVSSVMRVARVGWPAQDSVDRLLAGVKSPGPFPSHKSGEDRAAKTLREVRYFLRAVRLVMGGRFEVNAKGGGLVKFMPNLIQLQVLGALFEEVESGRRALLDILKARQHGVSTLIAVLFEALAIVKPVCDIIVASHNQPSRDELFKIYKRANDNMQPPFETRYDSRAELNYVETGSSIKCHVAREGGIGISTSFTHAHWSEFALWKDQAGTKATAMDSLPDLPGVMVVIESTARTDDPYFRDMWEAACDPIAGFFDPAGNRRDGGYEWRPVFFPWFDNPEYSVDGIEGDPVPDDDEEKWLVAHGCTAGQLEWRRRKIIEKGGDVTLFDREHPATPEHAFGAYSLAVLDTRKIQEMRKKYACDPELKAVPVLGHDNAGVFPDDAGPLRVYRRPQPGHTYKIGADPTQNEGHESDPAGAAVLDTSNRQVVSVYEGAVDPVGFADELYALGMWYNRAELTVERHGPGIAVLERLIALGYPNLRASSLATSTRTKRAVASAYGMEMSAKNKELLVSAMKAIVLNRGVVIYDKEALDQLELLQRTKRGVGAPLGRHDDVAQAIMIVCYVANLDLRWIPLKWRPEKALPMEAPDDTIEQNLRALEDRRLNERLLAQNKVFDLT
jgi:hypothetical protein